jgi:hypothetical protein
VGEEAKTTLVVMEALVVVHHGATQVALELLDRGSMEETLAL